MFTDVLDSRYLPQGMWASKEVLSRGPAQSVHTREAAQVHAVDEPSLATYQLKGGTLWCSFQEKKGLSPFRS